MRARTAALAAAFALALACGTAGTIVPVAGDGGASLDAGAPGSDATLPGVDAGACTSAGVPVPASERVSNGHPLLPPKWAFGILWGSYYDQVGSTSAQGGSVLDAATRLRATGSGDLLWIDSSWLWHDYAASTVTGPHYICFAFDGSVFPDPGAMIASLRQQHFHFGVWQWPWMGHGCATFDAGVAGRDFVMNGASPALASGGWHGDPTPAQFDFTSAAAVAWWQGLNAQLSGWGTDFLKLDTSHGQEQTPITQGGGAWADPTKDWTHERNRAAAEMTRAWTAANDPVAKLNGARAFVLEKAGSPGNDQVATQWTDDKSADWPGFALDMQVASTKDTRDTAAYWCGDTGGYSGTPGDELWVRWLEYSAFTPLQEFFGSKTDSKGARFPWLFGAEAQAIQQAYADLRYRLLPMRYSDALRAYVESPVAYPVTWIGATQLLVGSGDTQLLVQPVTTAGATTASVAFPAGATWIDWWTGASHDGGATATVPAPLAQVPLFVKAGSIVPMGPVVHWVDEQPADPLTLAIWPAGTTHYTLYEDDGISEAYLGGAYGTTPLTSEESGGGVTITLGAQALARYPFAGRLCARTAILEVHGRASPPASVTRDGRPLHELTEATFAGATAGWYHDPAAAVVHVKLPLSATASATVAM